MALSIDLNVQLKGLAEAIREVEDRTGKTSDFSTAFLEVDLAVGSFFRRRFDAEGGSDGSSKWSPLAPSTLKARQRSGGNRGGILWDFGNLRASLAKLGPDSIRVITSHSYERGTNRPGAVAHQEGRGVPKREIIPDPLPVSLVNEIEVILLAHVGG